jgi:uncharacterized protein YndB with AHSA1/START domain
MTEPTDESAFGTLERQGGVAVLRYRRHLAHPRPKVWRAMTEPAHLAGWFPTSIEGAMTPGAPLSFGFREVQIDPMVGEMLAFDPPALLEMRWGDDTLRFELREDGERTVLDLIVTFLEYGKAARDGAGWHVCLDQLDHVVGGTEAPWEQPERWRSVHPAYVQRLGPEASCIGPPQEWEDAHGPA